MMAKKLAMYSRSALLAFVIPLALTGQSSIQSNYAYDQNGRLSQAFTGNGAINYTYDNAGNRSTVQTNILSCSSIAANQKEGTGHTYTISCTDNYGSSATIASVSNPGLCTVSYRGYGNLQFNVSGLNSYPGGCAFSLTVTDTSSPAGQNASVIVPATITTTLN